MDFQETWAGSLDADSFLTRDRCIDLQLTRHMSSVRIYAIGGSVQESFASEPSEGLSCCVASLPGAQPRR